MKPRDEILRLFKSLSEKEKQKVLRELNKVSAKKPPPNKDSIVTCCPHCESELFVKNGRRGGYQNYKCKVCCKIFTSKTGTSLHGLHKPNKFELYKSLMLDAYYPIIKIADKVGVSNQTAFDWRHKYWPGR